MIVSNSRCWRPRRRARPRDHRRAPGCSSSARTPLTSCGGPRATSPSSRRPGALPTFSAFPSGTRRIAGSVETAGDDPGAGQGDQAGRGAGGSRRARCHREIPGQGPYPLPGGGEIVLELAELMRELQPEVILTHAQSDPYNYDHPVAADLTLRARVLAQALGASRSTRRWARRRRSGSSRISREMCGFMPDVLVDITAVFDRKLAAMAAMRSQEHLVSYYRGLAERRGVQAVRNGGSRAIRYAEAYSGSSRRSVECWREARSDRRSAARGSGGGRRTWRARRGHRARGGGPDRVARLAAAARRPGARMAGIA